MGAYGFQFHSTGDILDWFTGEHADKDFEGLVLRTGCTECMAMFKTWFFNGERNWKCLATGSDAGKMADRINRGYEV